MTYFLFCGILNKNKQILNTNKKIRHHMMDNTAIIEKDVKGVEGRETAEKKK